MGTIQVYQSELKKKIPLEYIGKVRYIGPNDPLSFINGGEYNIVLDKDKNLKIIDETEEDYMYILNESNNLGGKSYLVGDPKGISKDYMGKHKN